VNAEMNVNPPLKIAHTDPAAELRVASRLYEHIAILPADRPIVIVCLGTDRSTGDSLGPIAGSILRRNWSPAFELFGTLEEPVHAMNLSDTLKLIQLKYRRPFVIGVDACLGKADSVGNVLIGEGPLRPGAGVNKQLPPVGDIHISGVVNIGGFMEYFVLQNTRLHLVMRMAELVAEGLLEAIQRRGKLETACDREPARDWPSQTNRDGATL